MSANNLFILRRAAEDGLAADAAAFCAKHGQGRSERLRRQAVVDWCRLFFEAQLVFDFSDAPIQQLSEPDPEVLPPRHPPPGQA